MADNRVAKRYAQALFKVAKANDVTKSVEDDLKAIGSLLENDGTFQHFLLSPYVGREGKLEIAGKLFSDRVTALTMQALRMIIKKGREAEIVGIRDEFTALRRVDEQVLAVVITTSEELDNDQKMTLEMKLARTLGQTIEARYEVNQRLMGGVKVNYGTTVLDGSIQGSLRRLRDNIRHDLRQNF